MKKDELSIKEELFCRAYLGEAKGNGTKAAQIAGYAGDEAIWAVQAVKLLRKQRVQDFLAVELKKHEITTENVLNELAGIAFNKVEKSSDRNKALELLGKYLKLFSDNIVTQNTVNVGITFEQWQQNADSRINQVLENEQSKST